MKRHLVALLVGAWMGCAGSAASAAAHPGVVATHSGDGVTVRSARVVSPRSGIVDSTMCSLLTGGSIAESARRIIERGASGGIFGSLLGTVVIVSAQSVCPHLVKKATKSVVRMFRSQRRPARSSAVAAFERTLPDTQARSIARQLVVNGRQPSAGYINAAADGMCADVTAGRSPVSTLARYFPGARLSVLSQLNGVLGLATQRCRLLAFRLNALSGAILQFLLSNQYATDLDPPAAWIVRVTEQRFTDGSARVVVGYGGGDRGTGVRSFSVWLRENGAWRQLTAATTSDGWSVPLAGGTRFQFAVQALDGAGNRSPWAISIVFQA